VVGEPWPENYNPDPDAQIDPSAQQAADDEIDVEFT
jgi:hypothetical protein